MITMVYIS